jgi:hypothetical protein
MSDLVKDLTDDDIRTSVATLDPRADADPDATDGDADGTDGDADGTDGDADGTDGDADGTDS